MAQTIAAQVTSYAWLHSGMKTSYSGRYSFLAWEETKRIEGSTLEVVQIVAADETCYELPHWFGVVGYEATLSDIGSIHAAMPCSIDAPGVRFCRYENVLRYDHELHEVRYEGSAMLPALKRYDDSPSLVVEQLRDILPYASYCAKVREALEHIHKGDFYQVNLTRKYQGVFDHAPNAQQLHSLFMRLHKASPAPYSALLNFRDLALVSSSPELFLKVDENGKLITRPIKGTARLEMSAKGFANHPKELSENLMIVDLMRNDIARCCVAGSVSVPALYEVDAFSTLQHLSSTIEGTVREGMGVADVLRETFPPGSMTGAPKRAAMQFIAQAEPLDRGWYSGAVGWIKGHACEFSVVIRSLILHENRFEFQVGGGIVADSNEVREYEETLIKARGISAALGITLS